MCFSAPASFTAAAIIGAVGIATLAQRPAPRLMAFAAIPLVFATHQAIEGFIWLSVNRNAAPPQALVGAYLFIAQVFWPTFTPLSVLLFESGRRRRQALGVLLLTGLAVSGTLGAILFQDEFSVRAVAHGLYYGVGERVENPVVGLYVMATTAPLLMSRHRFVLLFGICVLVGSVVTELFFFGAQASVWCFFAAVASVFVFLHVRRERLLASFGPQRPADEFEA